MTPQQRQRTIQLLTPLLIIAVICAVLVITTNKLTSAGIESNRQRVALRLISEVMPLVYNNDLLNDRIEVTSAGFLGGDKPVTVFRAKLDQQPVGLVLMPVIAITHQGSQMSLNPNYWAFFTRSSSPVIYTSLSLSNTAMVCATPIRHLVASAPIAGFAC